MRALLEILSPAGCPEGVVAAVQNGADAVYLGLGSFGARKNTISFTKDELGRALEYCRIRGVKTYLSLGVLAYNHDFPQIEEHARVACRLGIDAIIVQDLGVLMCVHRSVPEVPIHAGERMGVHNLEGVKMAAAMGVKRVTPAPELSRRKLAYICKNSPVEIEIAAHGPLCVCYPGQCYMSALLGSSDNRGMCLQPCLDSYGSGGNTPEYPLSMKDYCLIRHMADLEAIGVTAVKITGRTRRPEYTAIVTAMYSKALGSPPSQEEMRAFQKAVLSHGTTDGYYTDQQGSDMTGKREDSDRSNSVIFATARKNYLNGEYQRVPVRFVGKIEDGKRVKLGAADDRGNSAVVYGPIPHLAFHRELNITALRTQLHKTGGTPFYCVGVRGSVDPGLTLSISDFNDMRRNILDEILQQRRPVQSRDEGRYAPHDPLSNREEPPIQTVSVMRAEQLSKDMEELSPHIVYVPITEFDFESPVFRGFLDNDEITVAAVLPRIIHDNERRRLSETLTRAASHGVKEALVGNIGHIQFARSHGMEIRGDFGLNVFNSETLWALRYLRLKSATLSFELRLSEIRDMSKPIDTELITYGRLPLMITENCVVKNVTGVCSCESFSGLMDESGALFPIVAEYGCRNILLNSKKLFMADRHRAVSSLGIWAERLMFTTENALECVAVMKRYAGQSGYNPSGYTRGAYFRGVE